MICRRASHWQEAGEPRAHPLANTGHFQAWLCLPETQERPVGACGSYVANVARVEHLVGHADVASRQNALWPARAPPAGAPAGGRW